MRFCTITLLLGSERGWKSSSGSHRPRKWEVQRASTTACRYSSSNVTTVPRNSSSAGRYDTPVGTTRFPSTLVLPSVSNLRTTFRPGSSLRYSYRESDTGLQQRTRQWLTKWCPLRHPATFVSVPQSCWPAIAQPIRLAK